MTNYKTQLKLSLQELRTTIDVEKTGWNNIYNTNCYAYALGLDIAEKDIIDYAFVPGIMSGSKVDLSKRFTFSYEELIQNLYNDFELLGINYREINPNEIINDDEWKIALFTKPYWNKLEDYHFLRLCNDGIWHHKDGWNNKPIIYDNHGCIITDPENCFLNGKNFNKCLSLKLK